MRDSLSKDTKLKIGQRMAQCRRKAGLTQEQLAAAIDKNTNYMSRMECGTGSYQLVVLYRIAEVLQCSVYDLLPQASDMIEHTTDVDLNYFVNQMSPYKRQAVQNYVIWFMQQPEPFTGDSNKE